MIEVAGIACRDLAALPVPRPGADHPVRHRDRRVREVHRPDRARGDCADDERPSLLIDGEHYPPVVRDALAALPYEWVGAILVGGTEKLRGGEPTTACRWSTASTARRSSSTSPTSRCSGRPSGSAGSRARSPAGCRMSAPTSGSTRRVYEPFALPSVAVIGTGKRVGKTAVTGMSHGCSRATASVVVVAMGRGGPAEPEVIDAPPTVAELVERSRAGRHAASDHLELAALCGVTTIGCRRAGGGLAGAVFTSNVAAGARLAAALGPDVVVFDGSGAAIPPVDDDRADPRRRGRARRRRVPQPLSPARLATSSSRSAATSTAPCRVELRLAVDGAADGARRGVHGGRLRRRRISTRTSSTSRAASRIARRLARGARRARAPTPISSS